MKTIFTLTSARSGTLYLRNLFQRNAPNGVARHEPFFDWGNPALFGRAIYWASCGQLEPLRPLLALKKRYVERLSGEFYLESSHAFLKSAYRVALEFFPDMQLVHLIRHPLKVAKSEAYRIGWRYRLRVPFHHYRGDDGQRYFVWSLTGKEPIYQHFDLCRLSLFQRCLIQWIEIENRAAWFLDEHQLRDRCFTLHTPGDLNDPARVQLMFEFLGVTTTLPNLHFGGRKNRSLGNRATIITPEDEAEARAVLERLPEGYVKIFQQEPYRRYSWVSCLTRSRPELRDASKPLAACP
jgi:hypothetical protein